MFMPANTLHLRSGDNTKPPTSLWGYQIFDGIVDCKRKDACMPFRHRFTRRPSEQWNKKKGDVP